MPGGTLKYAPGNTADITVREVSVAGGGTIDTNGNNVSFLGVIGSGASTGGFTKAGAGTLSFQGANAYVGATTVNGGTLNINADNRLGAFTISVNQSSTSSPNVTLNGAAPNGFGVGSALLGQTVLSINGTAVVLSGNASNTITANTTVSWVNSALNLNGGTLQFGAQFSLSETTVGPANRNLVLGASGGTVDTNGFNITLPAATLGTGSLTKAGAGTLTLSGGSNSYSGSTIVNGGTLALAATTSLPNSTSLQLGGGTLTVGNAALGLNFAAGGTQVNSGPSAIVATSSTGTTSLGAEPRYRRYAEHHFTYGYGIRHHHKFERQHWHSRRVGDRSQRHEQRGLGTQRWNRKDRRLSQLLRHLGRGKQYRCFRHHVGVRHDPHRAL